MGRLTEGAWVLTREASIYALKNPGKAAGIALGGLLTYIQVLNFDRARENRQIAEGMKEAYEELRARQQGGIQEEAGEIDVEQEVVENNRKSR